MGTCIDCDFPLSFTLTPNLTHFAREDCPKCNKFIRWVKHPDKEGLRTKTSRHKIKQIMEYHNYQGEPFCFFCLRIHQQLGVCETITRDHIQELDKDGKDELANLQILCTACHKLKNWCRLYVNWHLKKE